MWINYNACRCEAYGVFMGTSEIGTILSPAQRSVGMPRVNARKAYQDLRVLVLLFVNCVLVRHRQCRRIVYDSFGKIVCADLPG